MVQISEVSGQARDARVASHSHIRGLGLHEDGEASDVAGGFVGQKSAREVRSSSLSGHSREH